MNARSYRVNLSLSPLDFPAIMGLGQSSVSYQSEPHINKKNIVLTITKKYILTDRKIDVNDKKEAIRARKLNLVMEKRIFK